MGADSTPDEMAHDKNRHVRARRGRDGRSGFSLLEVALGMVLLTMAISGLLSVIVGYSRLVRVNGESGIAQQAGRQILERMQDTTFAQVFATYNASRNDDPGGAGTAPGKDFVVAGLQPQPGDPDGRVGEILFPMVGNQLREDVVDGALGMPRDLTGDGLRNTADHAADYVLLPVTLRLSWRGVSGSRTMTIRHLLTSR